MQLVESHLWIASLGVHYSLAVDGISVALILLTTFVGILVIVGAWEVIQDKPHQYMAAMLVLEGLMIGVFCATDALLFYVFFEAMLIPMFILIGIWGGPRRVYATLKFFIYTFFGSVFMLVALIYLYLKAGYVRPGSAGGAAADDEGADLDLLRLPDRVRDEGADGAGAYLVAGCPRGGADRRFGGAGGGDAEDRWLRFPALLAADRAGCRPRHYAWLVIG